MNVASEYSSGCESGWTVYFDHSFLSPDTDITGFVDVQGSGFCEQEYKGKQLQDEEEEEEEDLSMVSDASSGPPHFQDEQRYSNDGNGRFCPETYAASLGNKSGKRQKIKEQRRRKDQELPSLLDDTASSPLFNYKNNHTTHHKQASMESVLDFSQGFSSNFEGRSAFQDHYSFLQPSVSGNQLPNNQW